LAILFTGSREEKWESCTRRVPWRDLIGVPVVRFRDKRPLIPESAISKKHQIEGLVNVGRKITGGAARSGLSYPDAAPISTSRSLVAMIPSWPSSMFHGWTMMAPS
jgi:hypothetical protein